jgi:hypothetical protein
MSPEKLALAVAVAVFAGGAIGLLLQRILPESATTGPHHRKEVSAPEIRSPDSPT